MKTEFDIRWITVPVLTVLALTVGDANPWIVALAIFSGLRIYLVHTKLK